MGLKLRVAMPGTHRIPAANDHVPEAADWSHRLAAPDHHRILAAIDEMGFDAVTTSEHLGMPYFEVPRLGPYWMDALSVMSFICGATRRVRVDTSVLVAPYHHPLAFAKALATIDVLSGGRLDVSVGVGHAVREFEVLGIPFEDRGRITDEILEAMQILWSEERPVFHGRFFDIEGLAFEPKPVQTGRPPIYVGGNSKPALRRAARFDGWQPNPTDFTLDQVPRLMDYIREQPDFAGKESGFEIYWVGSVPGAERPVFADLPDRAKARHGELLVDRLNYVASVGVTMVSTPLPITRSIDEYLDYLRWVDREVAPYLG